MSDVKRYAPFYDGRTGDCGCDEDTEGSYVLYTDYKRVADELELYQKGYQGACYACEPLGELVQRLERDIERLREGRGD